MKVLSDRPRFLALTCHTPGYTPQVLYNLLDQHVGGRGKITRGEMLLGGGDSVYPVPSGAFAAWEP
jgi:23S rRNA (cytosine1962-C5)-methyltransferase